MYKKRIAKYSIIFICFVGLLLRLQNFFNFTSVDEGLVFWWILDIDHTPFPVHYYPHAYIYINYILFLIFKSFMLITGYALSSLSFMQKDFLDIFFSFARVINALLGSLMIYLLYLTGKRFYSKKVGLATSSLISFNYLLVLHSHIVKSDILVTLLVTVYVYYVLIFMENKNNKYLYLAFIFFGISFGTKYNAFPFVFPLLFLIFTHEDYAGEILKKIILLLKCFIISVSSFLLSSPNWLVHFGGNFKLLLQKYGFGSNSIINEMERPSFFHMIYLFFKDFAVNFYLFFIIIFIVAVIFFILRGSKKERILLFFFFSYLFVLSLSGFYGDRIGLPLYPLIALMISIFLLHYVPKYIEKNGKKIFYILAMFVFAGYSLLSSIGSIKKFNVFTADVTKSMVANEFRVYNNLKNGEGIKFASMFMTPPLLGDFRLQKFLGFKTGRNEKHKVNMLQLNGDRVNKKFFRFNDSNYIKFHVVEKPKAQLWDVNISYYYKSPLNLELFRVKEFNKSLLPRTITHLSKENFILKDNIYGKVQGYYALEKKALKSCLLYSDEKIEKFYFFLYSQTGSIDLKIRVNEKDYFVKEESSFKKIEIKVKEKEFFLGYNYIFGIKNLGSSLVHLVILRDKDLAYIKNKKDINYQLGEIAKFPAKNYDLAIKKYYYETGVDLVLLKHMNKIVIRGKIFPLLKGRYKIKYLDKNIGTKNLKFALNGLKGGKIVEEGLSEKKELDITIKGNLEFLEFLEGTDNANIILYPDYSLYLQNDVY